MRSSAFLLAMLAFTAGCSAAPKQTAGETSPADRDGAVKAASAARNDTLATARMAKSDSLEAQAQARGRDAESRSEVRRDSLQAAALERGDAQHTEARARARTAAEPVAVADAARSPAGAATPVPGKAQDAIPAAPSPASGKSPDSAAGAVPPAPDRSAVPSTGASSSATDGKDSIRAKRFRVIDRPRDPKEIRRFLSLFKIKGADKPESTAVNWIYRGRAGKALTYEPEVSALAYSDDSAALLRPQDFVPDSLIRFKTDSIMRAVLRDQAGRYAFANYEITMVQRKADAKDPKSNVLPAVPALYTGRYIRKLENRLVLGDAFQIRITYGAGGSVESFSLRDPMVAEAGTENVPARAFIEDSLARWMKSRSRPRKLIYPFHEDGLRIRELKPVRFIESYVVATEKFRDDPRLDGPYLVPTVTVLAEATLVPPAGKPTQPIPEGPVLLHFNFPCRPGTGLCWPDGKVEMASGLGNTGMAPPGGRRKAPVSAPDPAKSAP